jgi:hypothetical protein
MNMNIYTVETYCELYGKSIKGEKAFTPFDAAEKATNHMPWRHKEQIKKQIVTIMDGTKKQWEFEK